MPCKPGEFSGSRTSQSASLHVSIAGNLENNSAGIGESMPMGPVDDGTFTWPAEALSALPANDPTLLVFWFLGNACIGTFKRFPCLQSFFFRSQCNDCGGYRPNHIRFHAFFLVRRESGIVSFRKKANWPFLDGRELAIQTATAQQSTRSLSSLPHRKKGSLFSFTRTGEPVFGFRPVYAL
jgi:hypothetical protein